MEPGDLISTPTNDQECMCCRKSDRPLRVCGSELCGCLTCDACSYECPGCPRGPICAARYTCSCGITYCYDIHSYFLRVCSHYHEGEIGKCCKKVCPICDPNRSMIERCDDCGLWKCDKDPIRECEIIMTEDRIREEDARDARLEEEVRKGLF